MHESSSKEIAIESTQLLCEAMMNIYGTDRGNMQRIWIEADFLATDTDSSECNARLLQRHGLGARALYTLIIGESGTQRSIYTYNPLKDHLTMAVASKSGVSSVLPIHSTSIDAILRSGIPTGQRLL